MNMYVATPTPTEARAIERSRAFHHKIAIAAARLNSPALVEIQPEAMPAEPDPPCQPAEPLPEPSYPSLAKIAKTVSEYYGITVLDLKSARRSIDVCRPRHIVMYLCRHLTPMTLPRIGRHLGDRDHTTTLHGTRKIAELMRSDWRLAHDVASLAEALGGFPA